MYLQPTSPAITTCAFANSVVASVAVPSRCKIRHAERPSQVEGILMQIREISKVSFK